MHRYSVPVTHNFWFVHTIQSCFLCLKVRFQQENVRKGGIFEGPSCVLGGNQSISLSSHDFLECILNSIYFTDNRWSEMDMDYFFGGHNFGSFNLDDEGIKLF